MTPAEEAILNEAPPAPGRKRGGPRGPRKPRAEKAPVQQDKPVRVSRDTQVKLLLGQIVGMLNLSMALVSPEDMLDKEEAALLVTTGQLEAKQWPKLYAWMAKASKLSVHGQFAMVVLAIALPRLERHKMLPAGIGEFAKPLLAATAISVGAGATPGGDRENAVGQDDGAFEPSGLQEVRRYPADQNGQGELPRGPRDIYGPGHEAAEEGFFGGDSWGPAGVETAEGEAVR